MILSKGIKPINDKIPPEFRETKKKITRIGNYTEIETEDPDFIIWLQTKGFT